LYAKLREGERTSSIINPEDSGKDRTYKGTNIGNLTKYLLSRPKWPSQL